ncbi:MULTISPECIES: hypothetical protein [Sphingomonas]|uniref:Uncharacterized protein n=1 Tax=Sphingomonas kyungheensis TaxID=1069987 RepID=A0ABU8H7K0_9SPHN|nr:MULTISPECIES: hypothetical protein [unclassified Sphingomonas]EZP49844.1 hypothetical protein BW41_03391 [Sphingomonas sp. RIT328]
MAEIVITPSGPGAIEAGLMVDETGTRFVVLTFNEPEADPVLVTFTVPIFQNFVRHLGKTAEAAADELNWVVPE